MNSDTGNRTPGYRVRGDNVSHYTISDTRRMYALTLYRLRTQWIYSIESLQETF